MHDLLHDSTHASSSLAALPASPHAQPCHSIAPRRNGDNDKMFKDVPYFCYSHLLALITVAPVTAGPAPVFDPLLAPAHPLYLERVLTLPDVARARQLIALVCLDTT
jgi:hypothetical protein